MGSASVVSGVYSSEAATPINRQALGGVSFKATSKREKKKQTAKLFDRRRAAGKVIKHQNRASIDRVKEYKRKLAAGEIEPHVFDDEFKPSARDDSNITFAMSIAQELKHR